MINALELQEELRDLSGLIVKFKQELNTSPSFARSLELRSLEIRYASLEEEFLSATKDQSLDVCKYRMFSDENIGEISAKAVCTACLSFQDLLSTVSMAYQFGPELKNKHVSSYRKETELNFGYSMAGSVIIVMTLPNNHDLLESNLDQSLEAISSLSKASSTPAILNWSQTLGTQPLKSMEKWIKSHQDFNLGIDLTWISKARVSTRIFLQKAQIDALSKILNEATKKLESHAEFKGVLCGIEAGKQNKNTFHFISDDGDDIKGTFDSNLISEESPVITPSRYVITVRETYSLALVTDEKKAIKYHLIKLTPIKPN